MLSSSLEKEIPEQLDKLALEQQRQALDYLPNNSADALQRLLVPCGHLCKVVID